MRLRRTSRTRTCRTSARRASASRRSSRPRPRSRTRSRTRPVVALPRSPLTPGRVSWRRSHERVRAPGDAWTTRSRSSPATAPRPSAAAPISPARPTAASARRCVLVDLRDAGLGGIEERDGGLRIGATVTLAELAASPLVAAVRGGRARGLARPPRRCCGTSGRSAATSASTRAAGTTAARSGTAGSAAARPATRRLATTAATTSSRATASRRTPPTSRPRSPHPGATGRDPLGGRRPRGTSAGALPPADGRQPLAPDARAGRARRRRQPPGRTRRVRVRALGRTRRVLVPARLGRGGETGAEIRLVAAGVANVPRELDPGDPLAGLPGNPQTTCKRRALETLVERATAALG